MLRIWLLAGAFACVAVGAHAAALTTSFAAWQAGVGGASVTQTSTTGLFDPAALNLPVTSTIPLADGQVLVLSVAAQVQQPENGGFPYRIADGFTGDLFMPQDASGNGVLSETVTVPFGINSLGFEVVPFSNSFSGPYTISVTLAGGQSASVSLPGFDFSTGSTQGQFFGFYGGSVSSLTLTSTDPNGFAFGSFVDVPEPASVMLLSLGVAGVIGMRRRV